MLFVVWIVYNIKLPLVKKGEGTDLLSCISLEIYLIHGLVIRIVKMLDINIYFKVIFTFVLTILFSYLLYILFNHIKKITDKLYYKN